VDGLALGFVFMALNALGGVGVLVERDRMLGGIKKGRPEY
jgi:hypothetical protein